ncbi:transposase [Methylobacterium sp. WL120]|nr:transposase [Methylobacterium sp. WL120]
MGAGQWWDGQGLCLFAKRLEKNRFVWRRCTRASGSATPCGRLSIRCGIASAHAVPPVEVFLSAQ